MRLTPASGAIAPMHEAVKRISSPGKPESRRTMHRMKARIRRQRVRWLTLERSETSLGARRRRSAIEREKEMTAPPTRRAASPAERVPRSSCTAAVAPTLALPAERSAAMEKKRWEVAMDETSERKPSEVAGRKSRPKTATWDALLRPGKRSARKPRSVPARMKGRNFGRENAAEPAEGECFGFALMEKRIAGIAKRPVKEGSSGSEKDGVRRARMPRRPERRKTSEAIAMGLGSRSVRRSMREARRRTGAVNGRTAE